MTLCLVTFHQIIFLYNMLSLTHEQILPRSEMQIRAGQFPVHSHFQHDWRQFHKMPCIQYISPFVLQNWEHRNPTRIIAWFAHQILHSSKYSLAGLLLGSYYSFERNILHPSHTLPTPLQCHIYLLCRGTQLSCTPILSSTITFFFFISPIDRVAVAGGNITQPFLFAGPIPFSEC